VPVGPLFLYVSDGQVHRKVLSYEVDPSTGALSARSNVSPMDGESCGGFPLFADPKGRFLFDRICEPHYGSFHGWHYHADTSRMRSFAIRPDGELGFMDFWPQGDSDDVYAAAPEYFYRAYYHSSIRSSDVSYGIEATGIDGRTGGAFAQGDTRRDVHYTGLLPSTSGDWLFMAARDGSSNPVVVAYQIGRHGVGVRITSAPTSTPWGGEVRSQDMAFDADGPFVFLSSGGTITPYSADPARMLVKLAETSGSGLPVRDPKGRFLFLQVEQGIDVYAIDETSGALTLLQQFSAPGIGVPSPKDLSVAVEPQGRFLYASRYGAGPGGSWVTDVWSYAIDGETGALRELGKMGPGAGAMVIVAPAEVD